MNDIQIFNNPEFGDIRTVVIDGEPWFVGRDIAEALGYGAGNKSSKSLSNAISDHVDTDDKQLLSYSDFKGFQNGDLKNISRYGAIIINESGLYSLIFGSKLESAKKFKKWVTSEVLPTIRKTGSYTVPQTTDDKIALLAFGHTELRTEVGVVKQGIDEVHQELEEFKNDMPLLGVETEKITNAVKAKGVEVLGGKQSNAYNDKSLRTKVYQDIHREVRRQFGVSTYKAIKRNQCEKAIELIQAYEPPMYLKEQIDNVNAQIRINEV